MIKNISKTNQNESSKQKTTNRKEPNNHITTYCKWDGMFHKKELKKKKNYENNEFVKYIHKMRD